MRWWWDLDEALIWSDLLQCILVLFFTFHLHSFYVLLTKFLLLAFLKNVHIFFLFISTSPPLRVQGKLPRSSKWTITNMHKQRQMFTWTVFDDHCQKEKGQELHRCLWHVLVNVFFPVVGGCVGQLWWLGLHGNWHSLVGACLSLPIVELL